MHRVLAGARGGGESAIILSLESEPAGRNIRAHRDGSELALISGLRDIHCAIGLYLNLAPGFRPLLLQSPELRQLDTAALKMGGQDSRIKAVGWMLKIRC